jgi:hypothetical protein
MLPELPKWPVNGSGFRAGWALYRVVDRIVRQTLIGSKTVTITDTDRGQLITLAGANDGSLLDLGFAVQATPARVTVAAGRVASSSWGAISATDPKPSDWAVETQFTGGVLASTSTAVWLQVQFSTADYDSEGALGTESINISGAAGGKGGGGGGGGSSNGDASIYTAAGGFSGQDGDAGGAGGTGGLVMVISTSLPLVASGQGAGANGGAGGDGGTGGVGSSVTFTQKRKAVIARRRWTISGLSIHATKGTSSGTAAWVKLASIASGDVTQHVLGLINVSPPVISFLND